MRVIAIDYGTKRTGIAIGDTESRMALPFEMFENLADDALARAIATLVTREGIEAVIAGLPLNQDGTMSQQCKLTERFIVKLQQMMPAQANGTPVPVYRVNEFLSSHHAEGKLAGSYTRMQKRARVDALAAAGILQDWLDAQPREGAGG